MSEAGEQRVAVRRPASTKTDTILRLLQAARCEFASKGLAGAKIDDIARKAGVTKQLVYHYYRGKEDLFSAMLDQASSDIMTRLLDHEFDHLPATEALKSFLDEIFDQYRADPLMGPLAREGMRYHEHHSSPHNRFQDLTPELIANLQRILERGAAAGLFRDDVDPRAFLAAASLLMTGGFTNRHSVSVILGCDTAQPEGMELWRRQSSALLLASVRREPADPALS
jgi:AcrR family transcriptional regulator